MKNITHHILDFLPPEEEIRPEIMLLTSAYHSLGELKGRMTTDIINPNLIVAPLLTKEAVASSKIEGTQTTVEEVLRYEAEKRKDENSELLEVINYRKAIYESVEFLQKKPLGEHLIRKLHEILLASVRGKERDPGNYRRVTVHLGKPGSTPNEAEYIPPAPEKIPKLLKNWVEFVHTAKMDELSLAGIAHYQFEAIHPFLDGNGRIGRLLLPILLYERGIIPYPYLYISDFFEKNRSQYYEALRLVDRNRDWNTWIRFFLKAIRETAEQIQSKVVNMYELYRQIKEELVHMNSQYAHLFLDLLFERPIISSSEIVKQFNQPSTQTVYNLIDKFEEKRIISEITGYKRNKIFAFQKLIYIVK